MFRGINKLNLDSKGRIAVPSRHRDALREKCDGRIVMTIDTDERCLNVYPLPTWQEIEAKIDALPSFNRMAKRIKRMLIGHATEVNLDASGRLLVAPELRDFAGLDKAAVLVGQGKKFELWDEAAWDRLRDDWLTAEGEEDEEMPAALSELSL